MKKTELKKETKQRILKNSGVAIEKFRKMKKFTMSKLSKKTEININSIDDICSGRIAPTKEEVKICKAMDIPKDLNCIVQYRGKRCSKK